MADLREVVKDLVWQFACRGNDHSGKWLSTGSLSALEGAFKALGWDDPYYVEGGGCEPSRLQSLGYMRYPDAVWL
jgi:hypothetical protein